MRILTTLTTALAAIALCQCTPYQQQGAMIGGLAGGALGAIAGDDGHDVARGAALGAAAGTAAAAIHEDSMRRRTGNPPPSGHNSPPPGTSTPSGGGYPLARRTSKPNQVISPYPPYNVIDVTGFKSGDLARDPGNRKIFRVP